MRRFFRAGRATSLEPQASSKRSNWVDTCFMPLLSSALSRWPFPPGRSIPPGNTPLYVGWLAPLLTSLVGKVNIGYISGYNTEPAMSNAAQKRAIKNYRARLMQRGFKRFEVLALESDRELIRSLSRQLAEEGPKAEEARETVRALVSGGSPKSGGILSALRRSPLVGADLDLSRLREKGREVDL